MDLTSFFIGIIITICGINIKIRMKLFKIIVSMISSFILLKLKYPNLVLWSICDYFDKSNMNKLDKKILYLFNSGIAIYCILFTIFFYFLFYFLFPIMINKYLYDLIGEKFIFWVEKKNHTAFFTFFSEAFLKVYKGMIQIRLEKKPHKKAKKNERISKNEIGDKIINQMCIFISISFCLIFVLGFNNFYTIFLFIFLIIYLSASIIAIPLQIKYKDELYMETINYYNSLVK